MTYMTTRGSAHPVVGGVKTTRAAALLLALGLSACGGGESGGGDEGGTPPPPPSAVTEVQVVDGFSVATPQQRTQLDLSAFVRGQGATLTSVTSEQPGCGAGAVSGLMAEVDISDTTLCQYRVLASSGNAQGAATLSVLATRASTPVLEPLSAAMTLSERDKTFDVVALYGASLPAGYALKADSVTVQGGSVQGAATQAGNVITYTPPGAADWNRLVFTLANPARPDEDILGTLYVTVSEAANEAPTISNSKYNYSDVANGNPPILAFQKVTLDLANLKNLTIADPEGKPWQLIEVQSYSASVASAAPNNVTNKRFTFQAGAVGEHVVNYIVGDHEGGYRMGQIRINVGVKEVAKSWANITLTTPRLLVDAPPLYSELKAAVGTEFIVEPVWDAAVNNNAGNTVAAAGSQVGAAYCSGKRLPTKADLDALRSATGATAVALAKYPKARPYLITDASGSTFQTYQLASGVTANYVANSTPNPYVMCVTSGDVRYRAMTNPPLYGSTNAVVSDGTWQTIGTVYAEGGVTGASPTVLGNPVNGGSGKLGAANFRLSPAGCKGGTCTLEAKASADEYGTVTAQIANALYATSTVNVATTFLQNALVTASAATTNNARPGAAGGNVITLTLKDVAGNPVAPGTKVKLKYDMTSSGNVTPTITPASNSSVTVGNGGQVTLTIKSAKAGTVTVSNPQVVGGLPPVPMASTVTFNARGTSSTLTVDDFVIIPGLHTHGDAQRACDRYNARLPEDHELLSLFLNATSATSLGYENDGMKKYGWNLDNYWTRTVYGSVDLPSGNIKALYILVNMYYGAAKNIGGLNSSAFLACIPL